MALEAMSKETFEFDAKKVIKNWWTKSGGESDDSASVIKKNSEQAVDGRLARRPAAAEPNQAWNGGDLGL